MTCPKRDVHPSTGGVSREQFLRVNVTKLWAERVRSRKALYVGTGNSANHVLKPAVMGRSLTNEMRTARAPA
uniref:Uncharacterized protein n=1 Tax=Rhizophora mucronata TaxID=61149 RepID=A0A2P2PCJ2_RHIMU